MVLNLPPQVKRIIEILTAAGHPAFVVGGAVRDALRGIEPQDWDVATAALPEETAALFAAHRVIQTGLRHGTVTVLLDGLPVEITTFRVETGYSDHRHPDAVRFSARIEEDLARRDLTVNAMAYAPGLGIVDPFGGQADLAAGVIRCVGNPETRFSEDALRILRAIRFAAALDFTVEPATDRAIRACAPLLQEISKERIFAELTKLLCGQAAGRLLRDYAQVLFLLLPALAPMQGCAQNHAHHCFDVWGHTLAVVDAAPQTPALRWAALLHDCGKPACKTTDADGVDHFYGHADRSVALADPLLRQLKTANRFRATVCTLVQYHDFQPHRISRKTYKKYLHALGAETVLALFALREADLRGQAPQFLAEGLTQNAAGLATVQALLAEQSSFGLRDLAVNGEDLAALGVPRGPQMGRLLHQLLEDVLSETIQNEKEALLQWAETLMI